jgi:putative tricarboxylic transport membrane protein
VLGFLPAAFLILMALFLVFKVQPWLAVLVAIAATLLVHFVFYTIMSVPLPWGILETVAW